jgi:hypothetical protein
MQIECLDLGDLTKAVVSHDNKGFGAAWHLDHISVTCPTMKLPVVFSCNSWIDSKHGLEHTLSPATSSSV